MKKIFYFISIITLFTATYSCSNFDELNTNPDASTVVSSDMLATQVLKNTYRFWQISPPDFASGNLFNKHCAMLDGSDNPGQYYFSYYPYGSFGNYKNLPSISSMVKFASGTPLESSYQGLALFLKASYGFSNTLDMGDVPYSEAGKANDGIMKPKYDTQEDVFAYILADLKLAEENFAKGKDFGGDIMFGGDVTKWRKLCNAMQLKVIQTFGKKATAVQKARFAEIVAANHLMEGNDDIFSLKYSENPNSMHPFYVGGETTRILISPSKLTVDALKKIKDRRLFYFAEPADTLIKLGKTETDFDAYEGAPTELDSKILAVNRTKRMYSLLNKRYVEVKAGDPMLIFTYAEQCFILAEAVEEGWISGSAKDYYEKGVKASLSYYKDLSSASTGFHGMPITQAYIDAYFTGDAAYATTGTKIDRLHQIWLQRWLIDFFQGNGNGAYYQFLRTGYPEFPLNPNTSQNTDNKSVYPKRWMYPTDEQTTNPANYKKAISEQYNGYDGINQVPWWLK